MTWQVKQQQELRGSESGLSRKRTCGTSRYQSKKVFLSLPGTMCSRGHNMADRIFGMP